jgi:hypothetical protein
MGEEMLQPNITVSSRATLVKLLACVPTGAGAAVPAGACVAAGGCVAAGVPQAVTTIATNISMLNNLNFFIFLILLFLFLSSFPIHSKRYDELLCASHLLYAIMLQFSGVTAKIIGE